MSASVHTAKEFGKAYLLAADGIGCSLALLRKMLNVNMVDEALILMDMLANPGRYTFKQVQDCIIDSCWKLGADRPLAQRLIIQEDDSPEIRKMAITKPAAYDEIIAHLESRGINVEYLRPGVLWIMAKMMATYGFGLLEQVVDRMAKKQPAIERASFKDLCSA